PEDHVHVTNPIASDLTLLRLSLAPRIHANLRENAKHFDSFRLFEIGYEIHKQTDGLPQEVDHLVAATYTREGDGKSGLFELKRLAECLLPGAGVAPAEARSFEHPARAFTVHWRGKITGRLFELHPHMGDGRAAVLDINLDIVHELGPLPKSYRPLHRYPTSAFDLSVLAGERELSGDIQHRLSELAGESLMSIAFLRQYSGDPLPSGQQSLSYRLPVFAQDHTLTAEEVNGVRQRIIDGMQEAGYELRV
ncbi:MAG: phenylalanine--tRNA ligase subunit beta, partial [bacterium]|nr:phenylalanine--tRNA ligase subunit beta [bacterium]